MCLFFHRKIISHIYLLGNIIIMYMTLDASEFLYPFTSLVHLKNYYITNKYWAM